jgi:predicted nucleic acid-binding protein
MKAMMNTEVFFCDTYALLEFEFGNPDYVQYANKSLITSELNLMEFYYSLLKNYDAMTAKKYYKKWVPFTVKIPSNIIQPAMEFKFHYKKEKLSYVDAMGYIFSQQNGFLFLTGDRQFKDKDNVHFVK